MARVEKVLRFGDKGISVEEARKKMLEAGEAPKGIRSEVKKNAAVGANEPKFVSEISGVSAIVETPPISEIKVEPTIEVAENTPVIAAPEPPTPPQVERLETAKFVAEIFQQDGQWVGQITYKTGSGTERFEAPTRKALDLKLLEGKAHGTLRVREAIRREKFGVDLDKSYTLPDGISQQIFDAMPAEAQHAVLQSVATSEAVQFRESHPEYYYTDDNSMKIQKFLNHKNLPFTARNFEYAYAELAEAEELDIRPNVAPAPKFVSVVPSVTPKTEDSALVAVPAQAVSTAPSAPAIVAQVRKRGTTGLMPSHSSVANAELEVQDNKSREPSEAELRKMPLDELKKLARKTFKSAPRQF